MSKTCAHAVKCMWAISHLNDNKSLSTVKGKPILRRYDFQIIGTNV